ncbi:MAG: hypothetical protein UV54_C0001G0004 [Candidatus Beckwithbacteria bacterium GW2011_GWA2_43_10]|uniref:Orotate phosphoribosyltransferase n=1 Tax=Candidatus Beckwithbacteria bacterium GW2011_GWA2_43_10 TaxID=1618369 RepID=A0A0G1C5H2_9BACT|nr:MAG: hypothetical protein UV54_C0001G0004 [Candidatus Beckwithbacteria bacterium GW2011_GWA2_43_10]
MLGRNIKEQLILDLFTVKAIKFGKFKLKSGIISPYYLDLRVLVSYPFLLELTADVFWEKLRVLNFDVIVGVPYTAIPIATAISLKHNQSMIFVRKERKDYGTKKLIEGDYHRGQKGLIIDDVITNGESKLDTTKPLKEEGLIVEDIVVLVDRGQGGLELLKKHGYNCHIIFNMKEVFEILLKYKRISREIVAECVKFMRTTKKQFLKQ